MSDSFTETASVSWFGRIKRALGGLFFGILLVIGMVVLLFWNEGRAVQTAKSLAEGAGAVVSIGNESVDPSNEGKLVHVSGPLQASSVPADGDFGISKPSVRLSRHVEMYQWKETAKSETKTKLGGGEETVTTYTYSKGWNDRPIDSGSFRQPGGHANPSMEITGRQFQIPDARLGAFTLDTPVLDRIGGGEDLPVSTDQLPAIDRAFGGTQKISVLNGSIYLAQNPSSPVIGDYRISYDIVPIGVISVIGAQSGAGLAAYQTKAGDRLLMVDRGAVPAVTMFAEAVTANTTVTWILRVVGLVVLVIGFAMFLAPIAVVADVIPPLGSLMRMGTGLVAFLLAVLVGATTIAVAWFYYRPLMSLGILAIGVVVAGGLIMIGRGRKPVTVGPAAAPAQAPAAPAPSPAQTAPAPAPAAPRPSSKWN